MEEESEQPLTPSLSTPQPTPTAASTESTSKDEIIWNQDPPLAYLYKTTDASLGFTASIPWNASVLIDLKKCPVSGEPVGMVCDGLAAQKASKAAAAAVAANEAQSDETNSNSNSSSEKSTDNFVRFRFGKKTYQLSTLLSAASTTLVPSTTVGKFWWRSATNQGSATPTALEWLAQDRIAKVLDLASLKILHKGSLLYDSSARGASTPNEESLVSRALLEISRDDWRKNNQHKTKKATLVVMGTPRDKELPPKDSAEDNSFMRSSSLLQRLKRSVWIPVDILRWSFKLSWYFVLSIFGPFLPSHLLGGSWSNDNSSNDSNSTGRSNASRPHQD